MPKLTCNGFSMFAQHMRQSLEAERGRRFNGMDDQLISTVAPLWEELGANEKKQWKDRAKNYKHTVEFKERKRMAKASKQQFTVSRRSQRIDPTDFDPTDNDMNGADNFIGVPMGPSSEQVASAAAARDDASASAENSDPTTQQSKDVGGGNGDSELHTDAYKQKVHDDKEKLKAFLSNGTNGSLEDLLTFGNLDGKCVPAEIAINEFNLKDGVIDQYSAYIGPWSIGNPSLEQRAEFHANDTHRLPLANKSGVSTVSEVIRQVLGRTEPGIARKRDVAVGLYENGPYEFEEYLENLSPDDNSPSDSQFSSGSGGFRNQKPRLVLLPGDLNGRRWVICLRNEFEHIRRSFEYIKEKSCLDYQGLPCEPERFIFADTLIELLNEFAGALPPEDYSFWLGVLGIKQPKEFCTPWESGDHMFCTFHKLGRNSCCAVATARRGCLAVLYSLHEAYNITMFNDENDDSIQK